MKRKGTDLEYFELRVSGDASNDGIVSLFDVTGMAKANGAPGHDNLTDDNVQVQGSNDQYLALKELTRTYKIEVHSLILRADSNAQVNVPLKFTTARPNGDDQTKVITTSQADSASHFQENIYNLKVARTIASNTAWHFKVLTGETVIMTVGHKLKPYCC